MTKYYATITNEKGEQMTVGEYSEKDMRKTLEAINKEGRFDLEKCMVNIEKVEL